MKKGKLVKMDLKEEKNTNTVNTEAEVTDEAKEYKLLKTEELENFTVEELEAKLNELDKEQLEYAKKLNSKKYAVKIESKSNLSLLKKWVEKEVRWNHKTVPTLVSMYDGLKKALEEGVDDEGNAFLSSVVVANLYQYLLTFEGVGFIDAKKYLTLLTKVGGPISEAMKDLADDNEHFRNLHSDMSTLDTVIQAKKQGIKVEDTPSTESESTES